MSIFTDLPTRISFLSLESRNENESESDSKKIEIDCESRDFHAKTLREIQKGQKT